MFSFHVTTAALDTFFFKITGLVTAFAAVIVEIDLVRYFWQELFRYIWKFFPLPFFMLKP